MREAVELRFIDHQTKVSISYSAKVIFLAAKIVTELNNCSNYLTNTAYNPYMDTRQTFGDGYNSI